MIVKLGASTSVINEFSPVYLAVIRMSLLASNPNKILVNTTIPRNL